MKYYKDINNIVNDMLTIGNETKKREKELMEEEIKYYKEKHWYSQNEMKDWEDLFYLLQCLNPESDKPSPHSLDEPEHQERWEDICYYMDRLKPREEK